MTSAHADAPSEVVVHSDADTLAEAVAARLISRLADVQSARGAASVVLTGGGVGTAVLRAVRDSRARSAIDWRHVDVWWGDERYVPRDDPQRNELQARQALLDSVDVDPGRVFAMGASDDPGSDPDLAADAYARQLAAHTAPEDHGDVPSFDVLLLGVGPEGHIASIFPESPAVYDERPVVAVRGCPKPPPTRISLTLPAIRQAREVWFLVAGAEKAGAVHLALSGAGPVQVPAAGAHGKSRTLWLLDRAAAAQVPPGLTRVASP